MSESITYTIIQRKYRALLKSCKNLVSAEDVRLVRKAFDTAMSSEVNVKGVTEEELVRLMDIGMIITSEIGLGRTSIICLVLRRVVESGGLKIEQVKAVFGDKVAQILSGLHDISRIYATHRVVDSDNFRKLLLSFAEDVRVQLIFLAEKLYDLRHADGLCPEQQRELARETSYIYIPFAHRLGLYNIKSEMEDRALRYSEPEVYKEISLKLEGSREAREKYINEFIAPIVEEFNNRGVKFKVKWRTKTIASILNKMRKKQVEFEEIYDIFAVRFILESSGAEEKADCWRAYSIVADKYTPNPQRLRDWISVPKSNGYESLQTTVLGPKNRWVEVQIRTERMDEVAEKGFAAHWKYKGGSSDKAIEEWLTELREILESSDVGAVDMLDDIKINLQDKEVHVFTPAGDLKTLPAGATLLDFAYAIHTGVGSRCVGGKVNQRNETLRYVLKNGDQVAILTSNNQQPSADWLNIAITSKARNKIRQFLTEHSRAQATLGKEMLARRFKNWKLELTDEVIHRLQQHYKYKFAIDLYQAIAEEKPKEEERAATTPREEVQVMPTRPISEDVLLIDRNVDNVVYKFAQCCNPVFGDDIIGFVSIGQGIKIHRAECKNALDLQRRYPYRIVQAAWTKAGSTSYQTVLSIVGREDAGMVTKITEVISKDPKISLRGLSINSSEGLFDGQITVLVSDTDHLAQLISRLKRIQGVIRVYRQDSVKE